MSDEHRVDPECVAAVRDWALPVGEARTLDALLKLLADPLRSRLLVVLAAAEEVCVVRSGPRSRRAARAVLGRSGPAPNRGPHAHYRFRDGELGDALVAEFVLLRLGSRTHLEPLAEDYR